MPITHVLMRMMVMGAVCLVTPAAGVAQTEAPEQSAADGGAEERAGKAPMEDRGGEVTLDVRSIGLRRSRPGEWTGFQVELLDSGTKVRNVFVRVEVPDADGDRVVMQRWVVLNPGVKQSMWLFAWQPFGAREFKFTAYQAEDRAGIGPEVTGQDRLRAVRRIGSRVYPLGQQAVDPSTGLIAVVGAPTASLDQYTACRFTNSNEPASPTAQELTEVVTGLKPEDLPDRWQGLAAFEALVWTGREADEQPARIREAQAEAIKEWVRRGGHFIVVMPSIGQTWFGAGAAGGSGGGAVNPLADIMPDVQPTMTEGVDLEKYRQLLTADQLAPMPKNAVVYSFDGRGGGAAAGGPYDAMPIMKGVGGDTVVVRRLVGSGAVTVIGIDLGRRDLQARNALQAGQFWNRVLGKRMRVYSPEQLANLRSGNNTKNTVALFNFTRNQTVNFDGIIDRVIAKESKAAKGLLAAFLVFLCYWLIAGPLGYLALKQRGKIQHAWVLFVAATGLFAMIGWGSSSALKLGRDVDKHFTILDHVYGQSNQRMRTWVELTLPKYGEQRVSVRPPGEAGAAGGVGGWHHSLTAWETGTETSSALRSFPDARAYFMDAKAPDTADFPARATTRQLQIDYAGAPPASWGMIRPVAAEGVELGREIYIEEPQDPDRQSGERRWKLQGRLVHNLPGPLRDVYVFVVREATMRPPLAEAFPAQIPAVVFDGKGPDVWEPGDGLDLETVVSKDAQSARKFFADLRGKANTGLGGIGAGTLPQGTVTLSRAAYAQAFYPMLEPPDPQAAQEVWAMRYSTHGWDLGRWFTQPCVIVVGLLGGLSAAQAAECPAPISIDGAPPEEIRKNIRGVTVVRWVYPLPARPIAAEPRSPALEVDPPAKGG